MNEDRAYQAFLRWRWPQTAGSAICPYCSSPKVYGISTRRRFKCANSVCLKQFSATTGTQFASRKMTFAAIMKIIVNAYGGASDLQRMMGCQYKTAYVATQKRQASNAADWTGYWQRGAPR